ncbi:cupin [Saccharomonospora sp. CUA-673]|nr:cupin [Saccharomonospora sp. CUA-673]
MKDYDPERSMPGNLITPSASARWLEEDVTGNPSRVGVLADLPAKSMEFYLQEIPAGTATDLQRHVHESVHCVLEGSGYSEIGPETLRWSAGDFVYTPPWVWHRHYNDGTERVRMILVENSRQLDGLGINRRESAGNISYDKVDRS